MARKGYAAGKADIFAEDAAPIDELTTADEALYGALPLPEAGRVVEKPIPIGDIRPDPRQPRKVAPLAVRGAWAGDINEMPALLGRWNALAEQAWGREIPVERLVRGDETAIAEIDREKLPPLVVGWLDLLSLAASIKNEGQQTAIEVAKRRDHHVIVFGERRWYAHCVLAMWAGEQWQKIRAVIKPDDEIDVWRQAAENGARKPLNAIGLARQIALLLMDVYKKQRGHGLDEYEKLILPGECDRRFYAQVRDGQQWPIPRGLGQRIMDVTGLKSKHQIAQYRALLEIEDGLWLEADENDWAEYRIREQWQSIRKADAIKKESGPRGLTTVNPHESERAPAAVRGVQRPDQSVKSAVGWRDALKATDIIAIDGDWWQINDAPGDTLLVVPLAVDAAERSQHQDSIGRYDARIGDWMTLDDWCEQTGEIEIDEDEAARRAEEERRAWEAEQRRQQWESAAPLRDEWAEDAVSLLRLLEKIARRRGDARLAGACKSFLEVSPELLRRALGGMTLDMGEQVKVQFRRDKGTIQQGIDVHLKPLLDVPLVGIVDVIERLMSKYRE